jgi:hypothetical protein
MAESLLDGGLDWRDKLLLTPDHRRNAITSGLPLSELVEEAVSAELR